MKIEDLEKTFQKHANEYEIRETEIRKQHETDFEVPYPYEYFNLPQALHTICKEIIELKNEIKSPRNT
jgi:hypothetical protein